MQEITRLNTTADKKMNLKNIKWSLYISSAQPRSVVQTK